MPVEPQLSASFRQLDEEALGFGDFGRLCADFLVREFGLPHHLLDPSYKDKPMNPENVIEAIARVCHEANRAYCQSLGDLSQVPWDEAPDWQRQSAKTGVQFILDNPDAPPSSSHESWLEEKRKDGWKYGPTKDVEKKEHPCFVPYEELPQEQKAKDYIFGAIVRSMKISLKV